MQMPVLYSVVVSILWVAGAARFEIDAESSLEELSKKDAHVDLDLPWFGFELRFPEYCFVCMSFVATSCADGLVLTGVQGFLDCVAL
jgi:hypothetical protein